MRLANYLAILILCFFIISCAAPSKDPGEGGLIGGVVGLSTGNYKDRITERENNLKELQSIQANSEQEKIALKKSKADKESELSRLRSDVSELDKDIAELSNRIERIEVKSKSAMDKKKRVSKKLSKIKKEINEIKKAVALHDADIPKLKKKEEELREEKEALEEAISEIE